MNNTIEQGKSYKVAATQENTVQNSRNQDLFVDPKKCNEIFSYITKGDFKKACEVIAKQGSLGPGFFENHFKTLAHDVKKARIHEDRKDMILHAMALLMNALIYEALEPADEIITEHYWPEDISDALDNAEMTLAEASEAVSYELSCIYPDITDVLEGNYSNTREVVEDALSLVKEFLDVAETYGLRLGDWALNWYQEDLDKLEEEYGI